MRTSFIAIVALVIGFASQAIGQSFKVDPVHATVLTRIKHLDAAYAYARFNEPTGNFILDQSDPSKSSFEVTVEAAKVDTANSKRDEHLRSPDFFNARQFPTITFKSTAVEKEGDRLKVTGNLTLLGETKPVTATVETFGPAKGMRGETRGGFEAVFDIKRSAFGMNFMQGALGDDVRVIVSIEGIQQ